MSPTALEPTLAGELLVPLHDELIHLLRGLAPRDWQHPTSAAEWQVRDVVAHLLDTDLRRLSAGRDGHRLAADRPIDDYASLVAWLDDLNATWVKAARRLSPRVLTDLLAEVGPAAAAFLASLDPFAPASIPVAWAGEDASLNWLDVGREYTERWHHQDQIREAVGAPPVAQERWLRPVIEISLRALPHAYLAVEAEAGTSVVVEVHGEFDDAWMLVRRDTSWQLYSGAGGVADATIGLDALLAARILMHRITPSVVRKSVVIKGNERLAIQFLDARAVMVRENRT